MKAEVQNLGVYAREKKMGLRRSGMAKKTDCLSYLLKFNDYFTHQLVPLSTEKRIFVSGMDPMHLQPVFKSCKWTSTGVKRSIESEVHGRPTPKPSSSI